MDEVVLEQVAAKQAITEVLYRYCRSLDRMDRELASSVWHPGGTASYDGIFEGTGEGFLDWVWPVHATFFRHSHQITNVLIEVDADHAVSEAYVTVALRSVTDGRATDTVSRGRYLDRWSRRDGRWAIDARTYVTDLQTVDTFTLSEASDTSSTASRRDRSDPSYQLLGAVKP